MPFDLRIPIGLMFTMAGAILTAFGLATRQNTGLYAKSLGVNVNLWCGAAVLGLGIVMLTLGRQRQARLFRGQGGAPAPKTLPARRNK
jgi:hypothetical protein